MSNFVKIRQSILAGKEAVANAAVNPGEVLVAENPLASCLLPNAYNSHCQTCLKRLKLSYGCSDCSSISFCSYKCRNIGLNTYHKYECKIFCMIIGSGMSILSHLALRIVTQLGLKNCLSLYYYNFEGIMCTKLRNYLKLYDLEMHSSERSTKDYFDRVLMAAFLIQCLKQVDFFCDSKHHFDLHENRQHNEIVVGTLLLRHLLLLQFNAYEIYDTISENIPNVYDTYNLRYIGVGIYPTAARFNHECYSATFRYFIGKMMILRSSRLLEINNVIAENYGPIFTKKLRSDRQRHLYGRYWFNCKCQACENDWPLLNNIEYSAVKIRCNHKSCTEYIRVHLNKNYKKCYACLKCLKIQNFRKSHENIITKCVLWYAYGTTAISRQCTPEAAQILFKALKVFHHVASVPHRFTHLAELGQQYCLISNI
ncbi:SET and MYND domain-containing protein 4-like [Nasonia vitripennis]|uniref:SET and MYND domain-containing protein 4 n=1 Tax=Nasonia vitripennis TaxID=7425 RepID=A0A7M7QLF3_NASVI|nr:SET and MYND domain-containing protein 4-like [Nasonia vitripennis]